MRTKWIIAVVVILVAVGVGISLYSEAAPQSAGPLQMSVNSAKVLNSDSSDIQLLVQLNLHNPGSQLVTFYDATYQLSGNGNNLDSGYVPQKIMVGPGATGILNATLTIDLGDTVQNPMTMGSSLSWRLQGTADVGTPNGNTTNPFDVNFKT